MTEEPKKWRNALSDPPRDGVRVLCKTADIFYVAVKLNEFWFPIPFLDAIDATIVAPELWSEIAAEEGVNPAMLIKLAGLDDVAFTVEQLSKINPNGKAQVITGFLRAFSNWRMKAPPAAVAAPPAPPASVTAAAPANPKPDAEQPMPPAEQDGAECPTC